MGYLDVSYTLFSIVDCVDRDELIAFLDKKLTEFKFSENNYLLVPVHDFYTNECHYEKCVRYVGTKLVVKNPMKDLPIKHVLVSIYTLSDNELLDLLSQLQEY